MGTQLQAAPRKRLGKLLTIWTPEDREFYYNIGGDRFSGTFARPGAQAPRRLIERSAVSRRRQAPPQRPLLPRQPSARFFE